MARDARFSRASTPSRTTASAPRPLAKTPFAP